MAPLVAEEIRYIHLYSGIISDFMGKIHVDDEKIIARKNNEI